MAASQPSNQKSVRITLKSTLLSTRLKKIAVEVLLSPEEAGGGRLQLTYNVGMVETENQNTAAILLQISGSGVDKEDSTKIAFTLDAEMIGIFSITRKPTKNEIKKFSGEMADYILPGLTDLIEGALSKCGFTGIKLSKNFPVLKMGKID